MPESLAEMGESKYFLSPQVLKQKHKEVLGILKGLSVAQANLVLEIVKEDYTQNAIISELNFV